MPIRIQILPDYVHVSWHGELVSQDLDQLGTEMPKIGRQLGRAPNVLHTFAEATGTALHFDDMHRHESGMRLVKLPNRCRIASVCSDPMGYGLSRMMQMINQNPDLQMKVFSDMDTAVRWLREKTASSGKGG